MRPVSPAFLRSLKGSHSFITRATVCSMFQTGVSPVGTVVPVIGGSVTLDGKAAVRSTLDITVQAPWPVFASDLAAPYGNEIYVECGIPYTDDLVEWVGLGYHRIETPEQDVPVDMPLRITAVDRMQGIVEARLLTPQQFVSGTTFGVVVDTLVLEIYPDAVIEWDDTTDLATLTRDVIVEDERYDFLNDAITACGKIWYWDHRGVLVIKSVPSPTQPVYDIEHATQGTLAAMRRRLTRTNTHNAVVAIGEGADDGTPVRAVVVDDDPLSPTYFYGRFGQVPLFYSSPFLGTEDACEEAARSILIQEVGLAYGIGVNTPTNPALEPFDCVRIKFSHREAPQIHVLDTITLPFTETGALDATTREQRVTLAAG